MSMMWSLRWHFTNKYVTGAPYSIKCYMQLQSVTQLDTMMKSTMTETVHAVLRSRRNCSNDGAERTDDRRAFHARAAVTEKARSPSVVRRVVGMTSVDLEALRRRRREPRRRQLSQLDWRVSARYMMAPCRADKSTVRKNTCGNS